MSGVAADEVAPGENSWPEEEVVEKEVEEVRAGANSWSEEEEGEAVVIEQGGKSAPGTGVKNMRGFNRWGTGVPAPEPTTSIIDDFTSWVSGGKKATASVVPPPEKATVAPMTPMPLPTEHKSLLSPGGENAAVPRLNLGDSPTASPAKGGSRRMRSRKSRKSRKSKKTRKSKKSKKSRKSKLQRGGYITVEEGGSNYNMALPMPPNNIVPARRASSNFISGNITRKASNKRTINVGWKTQPTKATPFILNRQILTNKGITAQTKKNSTFKTSAGQRRLTIGGRR